MLESDQLLALRAECVQRSVELLTFTGSEPPVVEADEIERRRIDEVCQRLVGPNDRATCREGCHADLGLIEERTELLDMFGERSLFILRPAFGLRWWRLDRIGHHMEWPCRGQRSRNRRVVKEGRFLGIGKQEP